MASYHEPDEENLTGTAQPDQQDSFASKVPRICDPSPHHAREALSSSEAGLEDAGLASYDSILETGIKPF